MENNKPATNYLNQQFNRGDVVLVFQLRHVRLLVIHTVIPYNTEVIAMSRKYSRIKAVELKTNTPHITWCSPGVKNKLIKQTTYATNFNFMLKIDTVEELELS